MNRNVKGLLLSWLVAGAAIAAPVSSKVNCKVTALNPEHADFFNGGPVVGDSIVLDLSQNEITDLTFSSGNAIPLKRVGAKLVDEHPNALDHQYVGTYQSPQFLYQGNILLYCNEESCLGSLQILRQGNLVAWDLHTASLDCPRIP